MSHEQKGTKSPQKAKQRLFAHFPQQQPDETCFLSSKKKATVWTERCQKFRRKSSIESIELISLQEWIQLGHLRDGWVGWWWDMFQVGHDEKALRMGIWGSPRPPVGRKPGRPRRHSPSHAHPAHVDDEGGHGVEGMCFVRGMLSKANVGPFWYDFA